MKKLFLIAFERFSASIIKLTGSSAAFILAFFMVLVWAVTGPVFKFSTGWMLSINTATSIITFLMVFVLQQSQNKDTMAVQLKLNELIAANKGASNRLINSEDLTQEELDVLKRFYVKMGDAVKHEIKDGFKQNSENGSEAK